MNPYEKGIRERYNIESVENVRIETIQEGKDLVEVIDSLMSEAINEMREADLNNAQYESWNNMLYDFKTARHQIQKQLGSLVKLKMKTRVV